MQNAPDGVADGAARSVAHSAAHSRVHGVADGLAGSLAVSLAVEAADGAADGDGVVIIGGGVSALLLALRLSRKGEAVTVIEKNADFGGYNGRLASGAPLVCYSALGLEPHGSLARLIEDTGGWRVAPARMDVCDHVVLPELRLALPGTLPAFQSFLLQRYPDECDGLQTLCDDLRRVHAAMADSAGLNGPLARARAVGVLREFATQNYRDYLRRHIGTPQLRAVLAVRAFSADNCALTMLAYLAKILIDGLYALPGAGAALAEELLRRLRAEPRCTLLAATNVRALLFDERQRACGVVLADGRRLAGAVVSNVDPAQLVGALVGPAPLAQALATALRPHRVSLSALNLIFTVDARLGAALSAYAGHARWYLSDGTDPFEVLGAREGGALDARHCKVNVEYDEAGVALRVYVEIDCAVGAADFAAMAGDEAAALAPLVASVRRRLEALAPGFDDGVVGVEIVTPHAFRALCHHRAGAASGFADQTGGRRELDAAIADLGIVQIGQWSMYGSGLSQLDASAIHAYGALRRRAPYRPQSAAGA